MDEKRATFSMGVSTHGRWDVGRTVEQITAVHDTFEMLFEEKKHVFPTEIERLATPGEYPYWGELFRQESDGTFWLFLGGANLAPADRWIQVIFPSLDVT